MSSVASSEHHLVLASSQLGSYSRGTPCFCASTLSCSRSLHWRRYISSSSSNVSSLISTTLSLTLALSLSSSCARPLPSCESLATYSDKSLFCCLRLWAYAVRAASQAESVVLWCCRCWFCWVQVQSLWERSSHLVWYCEHQSFRLSTSLLSYYTRLPFSYFSLSTVTLFSLLSSLFFFTLYSNICVLQSISSCMRCTRSSSSPTLATHFSLPLAFQSLSRTSSPWSARRVVRSLPIYWLSCYTVWLMRWIYYKYFRYFQCRPPVLLDCCLSLSTSYSIVFSIAQFWSMRLSFSAQTEANCRAKRQFLRLSSLICWMQAVCCYRRTELRPSCAGVAYTLVTGIVLGLLPVLADDYPRPKVGDDDLPSRTSPSIPSNSYSRLTLSTARLSFSNGFIPHKFKSQYNPAVITTGAAPSRPPARSAPMAGTPSPASTNPHTCHT